MFVVLFVVCVIVSFWHDYLFASLGVFAFMPLCLYMCMSARQSVYLSVYLRAIALLWIKDPTPPKEPPPRPSVSCGIIWPRLAFGGVFEAGGPLDLSVVSTQLRKRSRQSSVCFRVLCMSDISQTAVARADCVSSEVLGRGVQMRSRAEGGGRELRVLPKVNQVALGLAVWIGLLI